MGATFLVLLFGEIIRDTAPATALRVRREVKSRVRANDTARACLARGTALRGCLFGWQGRVARFLDRAGLGKRPRYAFVCLVGKDALVSKYPWI